MTELAPRAFVVMPFGRKEARAAVPATADGPARPAVEIDFDQVYDRLVAPAVSRAGCIPFRADREAGAGDIRTDMYYELVTADVVVADISVLNPNVFYELGIRHGVAARGIFMIHGGWSRRPFDVAPDRTFGYDGELFAPARVDRGKEWEAEVAREAERLGAVLRAAVEADPKTIGSPVYGSLPGLEPADWSKVTTARAKYFGEVYLDLERRIEVAKLNGLPGDILTLADEAPNRFYAAKLLWQAADALCSMHRFDAALPVLEDLARLDRSHRGGQTRLGLVLGRLGRVNEARVHMEGVAARLQHDTEAHGILGRVYKDLWRLEWKDAPTLEERQRLAIDASASLASAIRVYDQAARRKFDYYNGVNVVSLVRLLAFLAEATGEEAAEHGVEDVDELVTVVRFAAQNALEATGLGPEDGVWAAATLGELETVTGDPARARKHYRDAANAPAATYFTLSSMLEQVHLFENLGFRPEAVAAAKRVLEQRRDALEQKIGGLRKSAPRFRQVLVASGHMIDAPGRPQERFPPRKEGLVRDRIDAQLQTWGAGEGDLAVCGGARGADMLFAELCADRGAEVWLMLPLADGPFLEKSVRLPESDWEGRHVALRERQNVKLFRQSDRLGAPPKDASVFARNNLWMLNTARVEADGAARLHALLVWDRQPSGDGPGGASDFARRVTELGGRLAVVDPTAL